MIARLILAAALAVAAALAPSRAAASPWGAAYFPNVPLVTQDGRTVRFYDDLLKDRKVLVNFVFTSCSAVCPLDTAKLVQVHRLLGARAGRDIHLYSITLDPDNDRPQDLKAYAEKYGAKWTFLTGRREDVDAVRHALGDRKPKEEHANTVRAGDVARGQWIRIPLAADAHYIEAEITNTFDPGWSAGRTLKSIAEAPRPEVFGPGELLFNNRCAACHTFGQGDRLGPDLGGVAVRRDRAWLARFLAAPDRMRASGDPVARELASRYKVVMPNLGLTRRELGDVLAYLEARGGEAVAKAR
ncbi:MAG TPA: SCO family protein [Albitalea sp.]